jgi:methylthioribose-1-phosphate isomerase
MAWPKDVPEPPVEALRWRGDAGSGSLRILDQTRLPEAEVWLDRTASGEVVEDVRRLAVRGAPLLGVAAAFGLVLAAREALATEDRFEDDLLARARALAEARPTAVNLARAVGEGLAAWREAAAPPRKAPDVLLRAARALEERERAASLAIGLAGADALAGRTRIVTHCNAGALVTPGLGTALAPLFVLAHRGAPLHVWVDETRPLLQGLRLTAFELRRAGISHEVIVDGAAASLMAAGRVDAAIVGADRVCGNGDVVNKIGTYALALAAARHGIPFLVAAPVTTVDLSTPAGAQVEIEARPGDAARYLALGTAGPGLSSYEPAFDVTPAGLVTALVTEAGVLPRPDAAGLRRLRAQGVGLQGPGDGGR